jgi:hypothetical protein
LTKEQRSRITTPSPLLLVSVSIGNDTSNFFNNDFFVLMNSGDAGQHELMYRLFYPQMVSLLKRFAKIHGESFSDYDDPERIMWSGCREQPPIRNWRMKKSGISNRLF